MLSAIGLPNCTGSAGCFSRLWVLTRRKLRPRSVQPSERQRSRNRFRWRNVRKQPTQNTAAKKRQPQEARGSDYLFGRRKSDDDVRTSPKAGSHGWHQLSIPPKMGELRWHSSCYRRTIWWIYNRCAYGRGVITPRHVVVLGKAATPDHCVCRITDKRK